MSSQLRVTTTSLPSGTVGVAYSATLAASGMMTTPYAWAVVAGALPAGLSLDPATGAISGTPGAPASAALVFEVTDAAGLKARSGSLTLTIQPGGRGLKVTTTSLAGGTVGVAYSATLAASGGTTPYSWAIFSGGSLPAGLALDAATGSISGTPGAPASAALVFEVTDAAG